MLVFFIQDAMKFPDLVHAVKPEPHHQMPQAASAHDTFWDFVSLMPESTHMLMWLMSDRAIPRSFATMQGLGTELVAVAAFALWQNRQVTRPPANGGLWLPFMGHVGAPLPPLARPSPVSLHDRFFS